MRKTDHRTRPGQPKKSKTGQKPHQVRKSRPQKSRRRKNTVTEAPALHGIRPPPPGSAKRGEDGHIAYLLRQAQAATRLTMDRTLADLGLTPPQFAVLTMLNAYPGLSGADVARVALLTPQTVGVIIGNLERDGAIKKAQHPVHGRMLQWTLTRRGSDLLDKCRHRVTAVERRLVAGLSGQAEVTIRRWLSRIAKDLHQDS